MMPSSSTIPQSTISVLPSSSSASSPCAACKFLRRKCQPDCVFAPYFPPDNPQKFVHVHRVFGASNVTKILNELPTCHREDAVNSLAYEADMRLKDPVYGCVGVISILQHQLRQLQLDLSIAKNELAKYQSHPVIGSGGNNNNGIHGVAAANPNYPQFLMGIGRDNSPAAGLPVYYQQQHNMMLRNYEVEAVATGRMGMNGGYDAGMVAAAVNGAAAAANMGVLDGQFLKANANPNGGEERPSVGP